MFINLTFALERFKTLGIVSSKTIQHVISMKVRELFDGNPASIWPERSQIDMVQEDPYVQVRLI